jgi:hypothetical protein
MLPICLDSLSIFSWSMKESEKADCRNGCVRQAQGYVGGKGNYQKCKCLAPGLKLSLLI